MNITESTTPEAFVCPWWLIHSFDNPLRRLVQDPVRILQDLVHTGDCCLDVGCGYGYFTIPLAQMVGPSGSVVAVDVQSKMLEGMKRRAKKKEVLSRIRARQADASGLHVEGVFDFALAFWMLHEVPDQESLLGEIYGVLKSGGQLLLVEPQIHVDSRGFLRTVGLAEKVGFARALEPRIFFSRTLLMSKPPAGA
jgi:ubiquinone/menaquinone biosynthesis C-methylase UbiE